MRKLTLLQRELIVWICFFLVVAAMGAYYIENTPNDHPGIIRLHITANSNDPEDQALKLKVRNEIVKYMDSAQVSDEAEARAFINDNIDEIEAISQKTIVDSGYEYSASARLKVTFIPEKSYDDLTLPAGNYEALNITLGEGRGHNWWCVIFPQLCFVGEKDGSEKIVLKSKVKEIMKEERKR